MKIEDDQLFIVKRGRGISGIQINLTTTQVLLLSVKWRTLLNSVSEWVAPQELSKEANELDNFFNQLGEQIQLNHEYDTLFAPAGEELPDVEAFDWNEKEMKEE